MTAGSYNIRHDQSNNLLNFNRKIRFFIENKDEISFKNSKICTLKFPLRLTDVSPVDSKSSPAIQLADILIGTVISAFKQNNGMKTDGPKLDRVFGTFSNDQQLIHWLPINNFEIYKGNQASECIEYITNKFS